MQSDLQLVQEHYCFGGQLGFYRHPSLTCNSEMRFSIYRPPQSQTQAVPVLYFLSGLTSTEENFMIKAGAQQFAAQYGLMLVAPDTSPRHTGIPGEDDEWDLGTGAGFYVDATAAPWSSHYRMYSYVVDELPELIATHFPVQRDRQGIFGHSMGGHGALVCGLRNGDRYRSMSAFAPIAAPMQCAWGQNAFTHYLGSDQTAWQDYDASELVKRYHHPHAILVDQGMADSYLATQLLPEVFEKACLETGQALTLRRHAHYDHGYYFIGTFIADHIRHHATILQQGLA